MRSFLIRIWASAIVLAVAAPLCWAAKKPLTPALVTREGQIVAPSISHVRWRPGHEQVSYIRDDDTKSALWIYDVASGKAHQVELPAGVDSATYQWSPSGSELLLQGGGDLWVFDVQTSQTKRLTHDAQKEEEPTFSPTGDRVAFVKQNNIYTLSLKTGKVTQLTKDGTKLILNGTLDWVYKEELADRATGRSYEWSPDGKEIAYLQLNDGPVPQYPLVHFLSRHVRLTIQRFPQ
ncbi:MAG: DPP IV N-terminal domain-containing protein, partial [Acidobacteriota bacterium]